MLLSCSPCNARRGYCDRICSIKSISTNTQHLPILAPGISPARALSCKVTGWILRKRAASCRVNVSISAILIRSTQRHCARFPCNPFRLPGAGIRSHACTDKTTEGYIDEATAPPVLPHRSYGAIRPWPSRCLRHRIWGYDLLG